MHKPLPTPTPETQPFWDGCAAGELRYQRCRACGTVQRLPRSWCEHCHTADLEWLVASGRGTILSYTVVHRAPTAAWRDDTPYVIAIVDGEEAYRLMVNVVSGEQAGLVIGAAVSIGFVMRDGVVLPEARLA